MYPPVVSVSGFANVDRGMFRAVSNLTNELECCKEQVLLILFRNSIKINLQISGGRSVPVRLDTSVYCTGTFTHISVSAFINGRSETGSTGDCSSSTSQSANVPKEALYICPRYILH
jgi:hypothetical protein